MSALLVELVERECAGHGLVLGSPQDAKARGNHVIYHHPEAYAVVQALKARGVVGDFRMPDCIRLGIAPIYLTYQDIVQCRRTSACGNGRPRMGSAILPCAGHGDLIRTKTR